jgi:hypothetical protein
MLLLAISQIKSFFIFVYIYKHKNVSMLICFVWNYYIRIYCCSVVESDDHVEFAAEIARKSIGVILLLLIFFFNKKKTIFYYVCCLIFVVHSSSEK